MAETATTSGVQELIDRLSQEGVAEGQKRAETIVAEAQRKADDILDTAKSQANDIVKQAREEAEQFRTAGEEALKLSCRDAVRDLQNQIHEGFRAKLQEIVSHTLQNPEVLKQMIGEVARKSAPDEAAGPVEVLLPQSALNDEEISKLVRSGKEDTLLEFVRGLTGDGMREGFSLRTSEGGPAGIRVRIINEQVQIDLTENGLTDLLAIHLLPRFREVLRNA
jgi:V/A-type H+-transporting ATPase subunit E